MLTKNIVSIRAAYVLSSTEIRIVWEVDDFLKYIEGFLLKYRLIADPNANRARPVKEEEYYSVALSSGARQYYLNHLTPNNWYEIQIEPYYEGINGQGSHPYRVYLHKGR